MLIHLKLQFYYKHWEDLNQQIGKKNSLLMHRGLGVKLKEDVLWLMLVHCFNHHLEPAIKDALNGALLDKIDVMLRKMY